MEIIRNSVKDIQTTKQLINPGSKVGNFANNIMTSNCCTNLIINKIKNNASTNLDHGSKMCPILSECRETIDGMVQGDLKQAAANAGLLMLYNITSMESANA